METKRNLAFWVLLVLGIGLFTGCKKDLALKTSTKILTDTDRLNVIKNAFRESYAKALKEKSGNVSLDWIPNWTDVRYAHKGDSISFIYIPLELEINDPSQNKKISNVYSDKTKRFIVATFSLNEKVRYQIATYISKIEGGTQKSQAIDNLNDFSGYVVFKNLNSVQTNHQFYSKGKVSLEVNKVSVNSSLKTNYTVCRDFYTCLYVSYNESPGCGPRYAIVGGYDSCSDPDPSSEGCYYVYNLTSTDIRSECYTVNDPNEPPPPPSSGTGGTGTPGENQLSTDLPFDNSELENAHFLIDDNKKPIDPVKYIDCFTDGKQVQSYKMTMYVDQPVHGKKDQFSVLSPIFVSTNTGIPIMINGGNFDVGHSFVMFEKNNVDGTSVRQVVGFYPGGSGVYSKGVIKDDSGHSFDVSYTTPVSEDEFNQALNQVVYDSQNMNYQLMKGLPTAYSEYNCTDASLNWMYEAGQYNALSTFIGDFRGRGAFYNTPGDLGAILYNSNSNPLINKTGGTAPNGKGPCN